MWAALARRALGLLVLLVLLSTGLFALLDAVPGRADVGLAADGLSAADLDRLRSLEGRDRPLPVRYGCWLFGREGPGCGWWAGGHGLLRGDLGWSRVHRRPVAELVRERLAGSLRLLVPAFALALALALAGGVAAALHHRRLWDHLLGAASFAGLALPVHWLALLAVLLFSVKLGWLPASGVAPVDDDSLLAAARHAVLPVAILALYYAGRWARHLRAALLETLAAPHVEAARARGLSEARVVAVHGLTNALLPLLTVVIHSLPVMVSGALIIERIFAYPGMGLLIFESVTHDDHGVAMVVFLVYAAATMLAALFADLLYTLADPRVRVGVGGAEGA